MHHLRRAPGCPRALGVFPGSFNPPTRAHVALARAALASVDEVVFVLPSEFPHKIYEGASFAERARMLETVAALDARFSAATTRGGLFIEIARECREAYGPDTALWFLCGRDAAERVVDWDYGRPGALAEQLCEYGLLVAPRQGAWRVPDDIRDRVCFLDLEGAHDEVSASEVRDRIRRGEPWEDLVPPELVETVRQVYQR
jgi:nicotinate (nicotinamide) nucleotide adenylyltransferase